MAVTVKHAFTSAKSDGADATLVQPSSWNADHSVSGLTTVATDTIWDAKGDLAVGSGSDAASRLAVGSDAVPLLADSTATPGVSWGGTSALWESVINGLSPVHWWKFADASGNFDDAVSTNDIVAAGSPTYQATDPFGGTSAATLTAQNNSTNLGSIPTGANSRTILMLFKVGTADASGNQDVVAYGTGSTRAYFMFQHEQDNSIVGDIFDLFSEAFVGHGPKTADGSWHLVAIGLSGRVMHLYIDGFYAGRNTGGTVNTGTTTGALLVNGGAQTITFADLAVFSSWVGKPKLDRLWDVVRTVL